MFLCYFLWGILCSVGREPGSGRGFGGGKLCFTIGQGHPLTGMRLFHLQVDLSEHLQEPSRFLHLNSALFVAHLLTIACYTHIPLKTGLYGTLQGHPEITLSSFHKQVDPSSHLHVTRPSITSIASFVHLLSWIRRQTARRISKKHVSILKTTSSWWKSEYLTELLLRQTVVR